MSRRAQPQYRRSALLRSAVLLLITLKVREKAHPAEPSASVLLRTHVSAAKCPVHVVCSWRPPPASRGRGGSNAAWGRIEMGSDEQ